jgi:hypothetical protein
MEIGITILIYLINFGLIFLNFIQRSLETFHRAGDG